jgi:hypothetical protein
MPAGLPTLHSAMTCSPSGFAVAPVVAGTDATADCDEVGDEVGTEVGAGCGDALATTAGEAVVDGALAGAELHARTSAAAINPIVAMRNGRRPMRSPERIPGDTCIRHSLSQWAEGAAMALRDVSAQSRNVPMCGRHHGRQPWPCQCPRDRSALLDSPGYPSIRLTSCRGSHGSKDVSRLAGAHADDSER